MKKVKNLVSIVIVTKDRKKDLEECIVSFLKQSYKHLEIIVIDNSSIPPVNIWLSKQHPQVTLINNKINLGAARGRNQGVAKAKGEFVLFIDDDAYADRDMVKYLVSILKQFPKAGLVQPLVYDKRKKNILQGAGHDINLTTGRIKAWGVMEKDHGQYNGLREIPMVGGICLVRKEVFEKIGLFDETYFIPYEDSDFSLRAKRANFKIYCFGKAKSWHEGNKSTSVDSKLDWLGITTPERGFRVTRNKLIFMSKNSPLRNWMIFFLFFLPIYTILHSFIILSTRRFDILFNYWKGVVVGLAYSMKYKFNFFSFILIAIVVFFFSYLALHDSLNFAIWGDDWSGLYAGQIHTRSGDLLDYTNFRTYFGAYNIPHYFMIWISHFWGYNSQPFYFISFIFRTLAGIALACLVYALTKNRFASLVTGVLFVISPVGLETTDWGAWNMSTYVTIFFFACSIATLIISFNKKLFYFLSLLLFALSCIAFPQRIHGGIIIYILIIILFMLRKINKYSLIELGIRLGLVAVVILVLVNLNTFGTIEDKNWIIGEVSKDISTIRGDFWILLITTYGNMLLPDSIWSDPLVREITTNLNYSTSFFKVFPVFFIFSILTLIGTAFIKHQKGIFGSISIIGGLIWTLYVGLTIGNFEVNSQGLELIFTTLIGGYCLLWLLSYTWVIRRSQQVYTLLILIVWPFLLVLISWARSHFAPLSTTFRYMIVAGTGIPLLFGFFISQIKSHSKKNFLYLLIIIIGTIYFSTTRSYLAAINQVRNAKLNDILWNQLLGYLGKAKYNPINNDFAVIYFDGDPHIIYNNFSFGFPFKMGTLYRIPEQERQKIPVAVDTFAELLTTVKGKAEADGIINSAIPEDRIYAFRIIGDNVIDIKQEVLGRLYSAGYTGGKSSEN